MIQIEHEGSIFSKDQGRFKMVEIFNYKTLSTKLDKTTRTLWVEFQKEEDQAAPSLNMESMFELESLLNWLTTRVEIHSVIFTSECDEYLGDWNSANLINEAIIEKLRFKVRKLSIALMHLPQTIIFDLKAKAHNLALELSLGADIRVAEVGANLKFNQTQLGVIPAAGGISLLSQIVGNANARNWILSGKAISKEQLLHSGFIFELYNTTNRNDTLSSILNSIRSQAPVQRIQTKLGLLENIREQLEVLEKFEDSLFKASLVNQDWKKLVDENAEFGKSKSLSYSVKKAEQDIRAKKNRPKPFLIKGGLDESPLN